MRGKAYLVGAGPGDPELLTLKAMGALKAADVVLHDDLVTPEILALAPRTARICNVGKRCGRKKTTQEEINAQMIACARSGLTVVRLKGGDPLIFGRAGEEMEALRAAGVPFEVIPGVTAASAAAAAAQVSLTDRRSASKLLFLTAHCAGRKPRPDWQAAADPGATLVLYMPGDGLQRITGELVGAGLDPETPCLIISRVSTPQQKIRRTTLEKLSEAPRSPAPSLLIVGAVAAKGRAERDEPALAIGAHATRGPRPRDSAWRRTLIEWAHSWYGMTEFTTNLWEQWFARGRSARIRSVSIRSSPSDVETEGALSIR